MGLARDAIFDGPGSVVLGTEKIFAQENITSTPTVDPWRPNISTHGQGKPRRADGTAQTVLTPSGRLTAGLLAAMYPAWCRTLVVNAGIYGAADLVCKLHGTDGKWVQFTSSAVEQPPELKLDPRGTLFGDLTIGHVIGTGLDRTAAGSLYTKGTTTYAETVDDADIIAVPYACSLSDGTTPIDLYTDGAWTLSCEVELEPRYINSIGTVDRKVKGVVWKLKAPIANLDYDDILAYMGPEGQALGSQIDGGTDHTITVTGATGGIVAVLHGVSVVEGPGKWGATELRLGEIGFETTGMGNICELSIAAAPAP